MSNQGYALARAELIRALTAYSGITTGTGLGNGTTLVDANLKDNAFISPSGIPKKTVLIMTGDARGEDKGAESFNNATGTITLQGTGFSAQIKAGTIYRILNIPTNGRLAGVKQVKEVSITSAANAEDVVVATITDQPCVIEAIVIHADAGQTGDMTTCAIYGGGGNVITFISTTDATQANLDAADKQVAWTGAVRLAATKEIVIDLLGTGATVVDLTITIVYRACVDGGYLV